MGLDVTKNLLVNKRNYFRNKTAEYHKTFAHHISVKGPGAKLCKELLQQ